LGGIENSCDVYFYKLGGGYEDEVPNGGLGIWRIGEYAKALGYGDVTGVELPGEASGLIPNPTWKRITQGENWSTGDTYIATIGQGYVLATPMQVLVSFATVANDGRMMKPTLVKEILDANGNIVQPFTPALVRDITKDKVIHVFDENWQETGEMKSVEPWTIELTKEGMRLVVTEGTAKNAFLGADTLLAAGKLVRRNTVIMLPKPKIFVNLKTGLPMPGLWVMPPIMIRKSRLWHLFTMVGREPA